VPTVSQRRTLVDGLWIISSLSNGAIGTQKFMKVINLRDSADISESWQRCPEPPRASGIQEGAPNNVIIQSFA
jgi:hypothetical protein